MYRKILVGFSGSEASKKAFDFALQRAAKDGAELFVVAVARPHVIAAEVESRAALDDSIERYKTLFASLGEVTSKMDLKARFEVAVGDPADQLMRHADRYGVNLVVLGRRERSRWIQWLFNSICEEVERYPGCPVQVVR